MKKRKLGRKLLSFLLTLAMVLGLMPGMTARAAGNGTEASPIEITSWNELSSAMSGSTPNGESADSPTYYKLTQNVEDTSSSGAIEVGNGRNVVLDLNGKTINRKLTSAIEQGYVIKVEGNLTIKDSDTGGTITGGNITDSLGGGVYINQNAKFNMKGGTISGNTADNAGGVYVDENAEFTMEGGTISGNTALGNGGGVFINQNAKFNMKGGTISGNSAEYNGGGVYLYYDAEFCLSGRPIINNNKLNDGNTVNVHILDGTIKLTGALESGASVGVTMDTPGVFTSSVDPIKASVYKDCFSSDNSTYTVTTDGNELKLSSHEHIFTYSAAGATITATCNASDRETTCPLKDNSYKATLTIGTPTGEDGKAVLAANPSGSFDLSALQSTIKYSSKQSSGWSTESTTPPTGDGFHKAAITLGEGDKAKTASVTYGRNVITYNSGGNGSVSGTASATVGSKIEFTVTPSANYTIDAITVKDADNQNVTLTGNAFTMPEKNVTVSATFKAIAYTVTVNGGKATVKDNTPNPVTFTAELKVPNDKMYDGTPINLSTATVEKSDGFPSQVEVGTISYKDQAGNAVTNPTNVGTYTASVSVGDKTISKSFKITGRTPSITYTKTTKSGNSYVITKTTTDQYIPLENNAGGITLLDNGRTYVAEGNLTIGALIFKGDAKLILRKDSKVTVRAGIYHIGSTLELYTEEGGENAALDVKGDTALSGLTNYSDYSSQVEGGGSSLSGTILIYGGKVTVEKGENTNFVANDISMTVGAGISAKGLTSGSDLSELTGGTENSDGSVTYTFTDLSQFSKLFIEYRIPSSVTTAPTAKSLTYSGTAQELVTAGEATGGTMQYALGTKDAATEEYTTTIPTGTEVGTYYVWYFVAVDDGYDYGEPACVKVIIEEAEPQPEPGVETVDIYGDVKDSNDAPLSAVTVQLKRGYTVLKETVTDGEGKYIFKNVKPGEYNIVATDADGIVKTILVTVSNLNKDAGTIKMPAGDVSSKLVVEPSDTSGTMNIAAGIVVGGLDDLADEVAQEGETTEVIMTVKDNSDLTGKTDDELTEEQILTKNAQSQIKDEAKTTGGQQKTLQFMDFSIIKVVSGNDIPGYISDTVRLLTMVIPFDTTGKYQLGLYRYHEGEEGEPTGVQTITTAPNAYGEKIEIGPEAVTAHVRFFSNYAIGYTTKQEIVDPVNPRRRGGGGGGASSGAVTTTATEVKIITFDANGGEGNMNSQLISGSELKLNGCTFTRDGYIFIGWNTKPDGSGTTYKDGESAKLTDSVKLYALWRMTEEEKYAAMMDLNSKLSVTATEKGFKVTWGKVKDASKYVIYAAYCGKGNTCKKVEELKGTKHNYSLTGLDGAAVDTSKDLKLYVVVYRTVNGKQVKTAKSLAVHVAGKTSDETNAKKVTADKDNISLSVGKTASLTAKITLADKKKKSLKHTAELRYRSSDKSVVTADKEGKLTAKGAGTAYVYIYAQNGVSAKVEVTVS